MDSLESQPCRAHQCLDHLTGCKQGRGLRAALQVLCLQSFRSQDLAKCMLPCVMGAGGCVQQMRELTQGNQGCRQAVMQSKSDDLQAAIGRITCCLTSALPCLGAEHTAQARKEASLPAWW